MLVIETTDLSKIVLFMYFKIVSYSFPGAIFDDTISLVYVIIVDFKSCK